MKKNRQTNGNRIKRWTACALAFYMAISPMSPVNPVATVHAAVKSPDMTEAEVLQAETPDPEEDISTYGDSPTELPNEQIAEKSSESTGFHWITGKGAGEPSNSSHHTWRFDFCGLQNGMTDYGTGGIQTTYSWQGYPTWLGMASTVDGPPPAIPSSGTTPGSLYKYDGAFNGAVVNTGLGSEAKSELRITVQPSPDNKYLYVDYYVYNGNNQTATYYLGSGADAMINRDDTATCYQNPRGFHMVSTPSGQLGAAGANRVFDCITYDPQIGVEPKPDFRYVGYYGGYWNNMFTKPSIENDQVSGQDSGIAWGWKFNLRPYETVHRRVAFAIRSTSYYVSSQGRDDNSADGTNSNPFRTIQYAIGKIGANKGYIYLMDDVTDLGSATIKLDKGENQQITISSTDYDRGNNPQVGKPGYIKTLKANGTAFDVKGNAALTLTDLTLNGGNTEKTVPMVKASQGSLVINSGTTIENCNITAAGSGSAVDVTGSANLTLNRCTIQNNVSPSGGKGAIYFNSSGNFQVDGNVKVQNNTTPQGPVNIYLEAGKVITVAGDLGSGESGAKIGVTTAQDPAVSPGGVTTAQNQEIVVAVPQSGSVVDTSPCPFTQNFAADQTGSYIGVGTAGLGSADNDKKAVRRKDGYTIKRVQRDQSTQSAIGDGLPEENKGAGEPVTLTLPPDPANYTLESVTIDPASEESSNYIKVQSDKTITGEMPPYNVTVYYDYKRQASEIVFHSNGSDINPPKLTGNAGDPVNASFPYVSRPGYTFLGWSKTNNPAPGINTIENSLPSNFDTGTVNYYAIYKPDGNQKFDYTVTHKNSSGTLEFVAAQTTEGACSVEADLSEDPMAIHGYRWSSQSGTSPSEFNYAGTVKPVGVFNAAGDNTTSPSIPKGQFTGKMPAQALTVNFRYEVDTGNSAALSPYTVRYRSKNTDDSPGRDLTAPEVSNQYPETAITAAPKEIQGYICVGGEFTKGKGAPDPAISGPQTQAQGTLDPTTHILTNGVMPNRPVEITYYYRPAATTYGLTVRYEDKDTADPALTDIIKLPVTYYSAEDSVSGIYEPPYGYEPIVATDLVNKTIVPAAALDGGISWAAGSNNYTGTMPNQAATVTYRHSRDNDLWKTITYQVQSGEDGQTHGTLSAGVSQDVVEHPSGSGVYTTKVLISDGSAEGNDAAYRWSDLQSKKLVPQDNAESGYVFAGWFENPTDREPIDPARTFQNDTTLTARFIPDPEAWCTINLAVEHGTLSSGAPISITVPKGQNWASVASQLPIIVPEGTVPPTPGPQQGILTPDVNYIPGDWYQTVGNTSVKMIGTALLVNGNTYTYRFRPDPDIFGTTTQTPNAQADLNSSGEGRIKVYTYGKDIETTDYQYILTNQEGIVLAVLPGSSMGWVLFDRLYPGTRYQVYEARTSDPVYVDHPIQDSFSASDFTDRNILSEPAEILTPVVETNYSVSYDIKEDGKTVLTIKPADTDSDYAVLTKDGTVIIEPGQESKGGWKHPSKNPAQVSFPGLEYNEEYIVVARPKGMTDITAESKKEDGSVIITDLGGEPELKNCIVETLGGTVTQVTSLTGEDRPGTGTSRYETAHKGDRVTVQAPPTEDGQDFLHWELLIGPDEGFKSLAGFDQDAMTTSFTMPDTNIVLHAVYEKEAASPSNATVTDEMRGGKKGQLALAPAWISQLETTLTTSADRVLMDQNHARVLYKVIYQKNAVKASESDAVKEADALWQEDYPDGHRQAYKTIFGLTVTAERYVDGRKIGEASPSDAAIRTYVQTGKGDSDMLDYRLYRLETDEDGVLTPQLVDLINTDGTTANPEETGGLFAFDGHIGDRYALVCSQAYRLRFINDTTKGHTFNVSIRVRKKEEPADYMDSSAGIPPDMIGEWPDPMTGAFYHDPEWSYKNTGIGSEPDYFEFDRPITKDTIAYAWYYNDKTEVDEAREKLEQAIQHALQVGNDHFLHPDEQQDVFDLIATAQEVLDRKPRANKEDLEKAMSDLKSDLAPIEQTLAGRYNDYDHIQDNKPQGGSGGGGGGGGGSKKNPYGSREPQNYQAPVNGEWEIIPGENGQPPQKRFNLNGGEPLKNMWAMLEAPDGTGESSGPAQAGPAGQGWYHFDAQGNMQTGWLCDQDGSWYYLNTDAEGDAGRMQTGFKQTPGDPHTYYLDPATGAMVTGWREIDGKWHYFNPVGGNVYYYDPTLQQWIHTTTAARPLGAMYKDEATPDGYRVGPDGVWIQS